MTFAPTVTVWLAGCVVNAGIVAAGGDAVLVEWAEMIHVFQAFPPDLVPEAAQSVTAMGAFLAKHFDAARD